MPQQPVNGKTVEQRVYGYLKKNAGGTGLNAPAIAEALNLTTYAARNALLRLGRKGCIKSTGTTVNRRHVATDIKPDDWRGTATGSLRSLAKYAVQQQRAAKAAPPRRIYGTELEFFWRGLPNGNDPEL